MGKKAIAFLGLIVVLLGTLDGAPPRRRAEASVQAAPAEQESGFPRVGAYFFYWFTMPDQPPYSDDLEHYMAFHPPALTRTDTEFHLCDPGGEYRILYEGGTYNGSYYNPTAQRWWEWQFRDMAEAGLDFAALNSWDGADFFTPVEAHIEHVAPYLNAALDALGNPLQIALYDDTVSEVTVPG